MFTLYKHWSSPLVCWWGLCYSSLYIGVHPWFVGGVSVILLFTLEFTPGLLVGSLLFFSLHWSSPLVCWWGLCYSSLYIGVHPWFVGGVSVILLFTLEFTPGLLVGSLLFFSLHWSSPLVCWWGLCYSSLYIGVHPWFVGGVSVILLFTLEFTPGLLVGSLLFFSLHWSSSLL